MPLPPLDQPLILPPTDETIVEPMIQRSVSWPAIIAGSLVMLVIGALLSIFGVAIGLSSLSPWKDAGASAAKHGLTAVIWLIVMQWLASALGGYITGRLRCKWRGVHPHESYFRDTAHGLVAWCLAAFAFMTLTFGVSVRGMDMAIEGAMAHNNAGIEESLPGTEEYILDRLLRTDQSQNAGVDDEKRAEIARIFAQGFVHGELDANDRTYLIHTITTSTGIPDGDANQRVEDAWNAEKQHMVQVQQAAEQATSAASKMAIGTFLALMIGMFIACVGSALGGMHRDEGWGIEEIDV